VKTEGAKLRRIREAELNSEADEAAALTGVPF
jgi:hypothetical protein